MAIFDVNNFVIVSPSIKGLELRDDFPLDFTAANMPANIKPNTVLEDDGSTAARAICNGEWLKLATVASVPSLSRGSLTASDELTALTAGDEGSQKWAVFAEKGRFDVQTLKKYVPIIWQGAYEVDTKVIDTATGLVTWSGVAIGSRLVAACGGFTGDTFGADASTSHRGYSVLAPQPAAGKGMVLGVVTKVYSSATGYVRIRVQAGGFGLYY